MIIKSELGKIDIDRKIFAKCVNKAFSLIDDRAYLVSPKGKALGGVNKNIGINELSQNIFLDFNCDTITIKTYIVMNFGHSISTTSNIFFDSLAYDIQNIFPNFKIKLIIKVLGVKSIKFASRNIEITKEYEPR